MAGKFCQSEADSAGGTIGGGGSETRGSVFDIKKYAIHDGPGIRMTVFLKGCPLRCQWCHNPESWTWSPELRVCSAKCIRCGRCVEVCPGGAISTVDGEPVTDIEKCTLCGGCVDVCAAGARQLVGRTVSASEVMEKIEKDIIFYDESGGGATFSGGEPLMQPEFLCELLAQCRAREIHTAVDTTCFAEPEIIEKVSKGADLFLCDLKHIDSEIHKRFTGVGNEVILENIRKLASSGKDIIIRLPVIPGFNDDDANIEATGKFAASLGVIRRIDILPYNRGGLEKSALLAEEYELMESSRPADERMDSIAEKLRGFGFEVKAGG